jgi:hypothetical protein
LALAQRRRAVVVADPPYRVFGISRYGFITYMRQSLGVRPGDIGVVRETVDHRGDDMPAMRKDPPILTLLMI